MANDIEFRIVGKDAFSSSMKSVRASINGAAKAAAAFTIAKSAGIVAAGLAITKVGSEIESLQIRLNSLLGSVTEGNKVFQDMSEFASRVPFEYREIMNAATQLSGVMENGVNDINRYMPIIADLAAVSGLSIQQTTEQVVRMYSAGAASADLFRERGITAMLGFQAGVSYSALETRDRLIEAFEDPMSKFRGAAKELSTTWDGILSMIGDKWFNMKAQLADAGLFNYFKGIAMAIDQTMGRALQNTKDNAVVWSNTLIDGIRSIMDAVGFMADMFMGLRAVWSGLKVLFAGMAQGIIESIYTIINGWRQLLNLIPGIDLGKMETFESTLKNARDRTSELNGEFHALIASAASGMPSAAVDNFINDVEMNFLRLQEISASTRDKVVEDQRQATVETLENIKTRIDAEIESYQRQLEHLTEFSGSMREIWGLTMAEIYVNAQTLGEQTSGLIMKSFDAITTGIGNSVASAIVDGKNLFDSLKQVFKGVLKMIISGLIQMGIQRTIISGIFGAASAKENAAALYAGFSQAFTNAYASTAAIPIIGPVLAPAAAAKALAEVSAGAPAAGAVGAGIGAAAGALHGGMTNVPSERSYLLDAGERVLSPNQNADLTEFLRGAPGGGSPITIESVAVVVNTQAQSLEDINPDEAEAFVADVVIPALDVLDDNGVRQRALQRSNV